MGYCFITGRKVRGRWKFDRCDGRASIDASDCGGGDPSIFKHEGAGKHRCTDCIEYCQRYKDAVAAINDWLKLHPGEE